MVCGGGGVWCGVFVVVVWLGLEVCGGVVCVWLCWWGVVVWWLW